MCQKGGFVVFTGFDWLFFISIIDGIISDKIQNQDRNPQKWCQPFKQGQTWLLSGGRVIGYLYILHKDLSCHAHLQHPVDDQFAVGCEHVSAPVKVLEPLCFRVFTGWGIQMESKYTRTMGGGSEREKNKAETRDGVKVFQFDSRQWL